MGAISSDIYSQIGLGVQQQSRNENLGQADFLRLMTEQLKNQDPLKPLSNNEFLGQLAQFSTVQGIQDLNAGFGGLQSALGGDQVLRAASLVGHEVLVPSDRVQLVPGEPAEGLVATPSAGTVVMDIKDASGQLVRRLEIASPGAGPRSSGASPASTRASWAPAIDAITSGPWPACVAQRISAKEAKPPPP